MPPVEQEMRAECAGRFATIEECIKGIAKWQETWETNHMPTIYAKLDAMGVELNLRYVEMLRLIGGRPSWAIMVIVSVLIGTIGVLAGIASGK